MDVTLPLEDVQSTSGHTPMEKNSFPSNHELSISPYLRVEPHESCHSCWNANWLDLLQVLC